MGFCMDDECWRLYEQKVHDILVQGFSDRVKLVRVIWRNTPSEYIIENVRYQDLNFRFHIDICYIAYSWSLEKMGSWLQGLSVFNSVPLLIGISVSSFEKAFRVVDIGPNAENKDEVYKAFSSYFKPNICFEQVFILLLLWRLSNSASFGGKRPN